MPRKRTAEERGRYAEENDFDDDTDFDDCPVPRDVLEYTKAISIVVLFPEPRLLLPELRVR
jgi:hypothetical protein